MSKYIFLVLLMVTVQARAVGFHCYSMPNTFIQTYEYGSGICMDGDRATGTTEEIGKDGDRPILCVVTATCKTVDDKEALKPPPPLDTVEVQRQFNARILKFSQLYCKGTSKFVGGLAASATCPSVDECRDQVLFNYFTPGMAPTLEVPINVNNPDAKLKSETEGER